MRYMCFVKMADDVGETPTALYEAMGAEMENAFASGLMLDAGGLFPLSQSTEIRLAEGKITTVDGPYAEAKEVVGGWSIMQYDSLEEAVADQREFAELHARYWPEVTVISTLRQISTGPEAPGD